MLRIIATALRAGRTTESPQSLAEPAPLATRGRPVLDAARCDANAACVAACPSAAITLSATQAEGERLFSLDYGACVFCGRCAAVCVPGALTITADYALAAMQRRDLVWQSLVVVRQEGQ